MVYRNSSGDELNKQGFLNSHDNCAASDSSVPSDRSRLIFLVLFWTLTAIGLFFAFF